MKYDIIDIQPSRVKHKIQIIDSLTSFRVTVAILSTCHKNEINLSFKINFSIRRHTLDATLRAAVAIPATVSTGYAL